MEYTMSISPATRKILSTRAGVLRFPEEAAAEIANPTEDNLVINNTYALLQATPNQIVPNTSNVGSVGTVTIDTSVSRYPNGKSIKIPVTATGTQQVRWIGGPRPVDGGTRGPQPFSNASEIIMWYYIPDAAALANFTSLSIKLYTDPTSTTEHVWNRATNDGDQPPTVVGWNLARWIAHGGVTTGWDLTDSSVYRLDILPVGTGAFDVFIDSLSMVERNKASIIFVNDQSVRHFMDGTDAAGVRVGGYPDLKNRGLPCVFATQPGNWGIDSARATKAEMLTLAEDGNEISYHSYAGEGDTPSVLTEDQMYDYNTKCIRDLKELGVPWFPWRAAILGNASAALTTNPALLSDQLYAYPAGVGSAGRDIFPLFDPQKVRRTAIHNRTQTELTGFFTDLKKTKAVEIHYTHYVANDSLTVNMQQLDWEFYLAEMDKGISEGWLEVVTMEQLFRRNGGKYINGTGSPYWEWRDNSGAIKQIPA